MKTKLLLLFIAGITFTSCSVDPIEPTIYSGEVLEMNSSADEPGCAGPDNSKTIQISEARAIESWDEVRKLYLSLLPEEVSREGSFDPSIWDIIDAFNEAEDPLGEYTTTYTLTEGECIDTVELTVVVVPDEQQEPVCDDVIAGPDNSKSLTISAAAAIESWDEVRKLYLNLLADGVSREGSFDPSIWDLINAFNEAENPIGDYTTTYTIVEGECSDSVELTITVIPDEQQEPTCEDVNAGADNSMTLTQSEAAAIESWDEVRKLYLRLLSDGVSREGSFDPSIWDLINAFNEAENPIGEYTTTYTITDGECSDSVDLTVNVVAD